MCTYLRTCYYILRDCCAKRGARRWQIKIIKAIKDCIVAVWYQKPHKCLKKLSLSSFIILLEQNLYFFCNKKSCISLFDIIIIDKTFEGFLQKNSIIFANISFACLTFSDLCLPHKLLIVFCVYYASYPSGLEEGKLSVNIIESFRILIITTLLYVVWKITTKFISLEFPDLILNKSQWSSLAWNYQIWY